MLKKKKSKANQLKIQLLIQLAHENSYWKYNTVTKSPLPLPFLEILGFCLTAAILRNQMCADRRMYHRGGKHLKPESRDTTFSSPNCQQPTFDKNFFLFHCQPLTSIFVRLQWVCSQSALWISTSWVWIQACLVYIQPQPSTFFPLFLEIEAQRNSELDSLNCVCVSVCVWKVCRILISPMYQWELRGMNGFPHPVLKNWAKLKHKQVVATCTQVEAHSLAEHTNWVIARWESVIG